MSQLGWPPGDMIGRCWRAYLANAVTVLLTVALKRLLGGALAATYRRATAELLLLLQRYSVPRGLCPATHRFVLKFMKRMM